MLGVLDPRLLLDDAAALAARYGGGLLIAETLAAGLVHGRRLYFGTPANVGRHLASAAVDLGIAVPRHHLKIVVDASIPAPDSRTASPTPMHPTCGRRLSPRR